MRPSACFTRARPCIRCVSRCSEFPLTRPLLSTTSAAGRPALFGRFFDTTGLSDSSSLFILGYAFRLPSAPHVALDRGEVGGLPGSSIVFPHMHGVSDPGCPSPSRLTTCWILPSACPDDVGASHWIDFEAHKPSLCVPLSTLRPRPRDRQRMTQGRGGLLETRPTRGC